MKELIKVKSINGELLLNARYLHEGLGINSEYQDWIKRIIDYYGFEENIDYITIREPAEKREGSKLFIISLETHILKLDTAKKIAMLQMNDKGRQYKEYFLDVERKYKEINK